MRLEHLGIAVRDADAVATLFHDLLGVTPYKSEEVASEAVRTVFIDAGGPKLELLVATSPDSPIARHIERRGEGLHHVAFEVRNLDAAFKRLAEAGFRLLNDAPKRGADGKRIFFLHPRDTAGVLVELCETAPVPLEPSFAPAEGGRVAYFDGGHQEAPPLLVLHGALGSTEMEMRRLLPHLEPHFRTIAIDFGAHGRSDDFELEGPLTMEFFADNVLAVLDHLGLEHAHVFGFSMGGAVALYLAHRHPERVGRLAVHGVNVQWDDDEAEVMTRSMNPEALAGVAPRWAERLDAAHGASRWQDLSRRMIAFTEALPGRRFPDEALATIQAPTLVSAGDSDRYFRIEHALHLWRTLPDARLAVHPGLDHPIQHVDPARFAATVREFLLL